MRSVFESNFSGNGSWKAQIQKTQIKKNTHEKIITDNNCICFYECAQRECRVERNNQNAKYG